MLGKVTKRTVDALNPGERDVFLWDSDLRGFGVKCTPKGRKVYVVQYQRGGRGNPTRRVTIGPHGPLTPDKARTEAEWSCPGFVDGYGFGRAGGSWLLSKLMGDR